MQTENKILMLDINLVVPNKYQPRKIFDEKELTTLSESIKTYGIINPILVREKENQYEIIAGERRYRAAKKAGLTTVPVIVKTATEQQMAELALIENIQRQDLSPVEEAKSYEEILKIGNQTQEELAKKIGKSQSSIANKIRLLSLPQEIQDALINRKISERHARSLLTVDNTETQLDYLNQIIEGKLTVKETEQLINQKEITEEEIKQAINDIIKSLNIDEEKEEKEDDNMNNGNFFPNYDNNTNNNPNNTSLNMMNMQSMNPTYIEPQNEMVMPTPLNNVTSPINVGTQYTDQQVDPTVQPQFDFSGPVNTSQMDNTYQNNAFINPQPNLNTGFVETPQTIEPMYQAPFVNPMESTVVPESTPVMQETPLFNPTAFEIPVMPEVAPSPSIEQDKLTSLQTLLNNNGYIYKVYSNDTDNCIIIELPKN